MDEYKIVISSNGTYQEAVLTPKLKKIAIGSADDCDYVIDTDSKIKIELEYRDDSWQLECEEGTYFLFGGITKMVSKKLNHGDDLVFKCEGRAEEIFSLSFMLNFVFYDKRYDYAIDIQNTDRITIGRDSRFNIYLKDELLGTDYFEIVHDGGNYTLKDNNSKYGVYVNGKRIQKQQVLREFDFIFILEYAFYFKEGNLYTDLFDTEKITVNGLKSTLIPEQKSTLEYPKFNRNTRVKTVLDEERVVVIVRV